MDKQLFKEALQKFKEALFGKGHQEFKVWSDTELKISQPEVGGKVEIIDGATGELTPAEDGDYEMDNGFKFTVKDGQIASIEGQDKPEEKKDEEAPVDAAEEAETPTEEAPTEEQPDEVAELKAKVADLEALVAGLAQAMEELKGSTAGAASKEDVDAFSKEVANLTETIQKLAKVPVEFSKTSTNNTVKESKEDKLFELARVLGKK